MGKILTVAIAAYNMERYIGNCLDSLTATEIKDDLEVLVIDDGGKDRTLEIAREYATKYPGTFIPIHKENGGYGSTYDEGIARATGTYYKVLDGDDWFDTKGLVRLVHALKTTTADVVATDYLCGSDPESMQLKRVAGAPADREVAISQVADQLTLLNMWHICYRTELLRKCGLTLSTCRMYADMPYFIKPMVLAKTLLYLAWPVYCYRMGHDGQSVSRASLLKNQQMVLNICCDLLEFGASQDVTASSNRVYITRRIAGCYLMTVKILLLDKICAENLRKIRQLEANCRENSRAVYDMAEHVGKVGMLLRILRKTRYLPYWLLRLIPGGMPNTILFEKKGANIMKVREAIHNRKKTGGGYRKSIALLDCIRTNWHREYQFVSIAYGRAA